MQKYFDLLLELLRPEDDDFVMEEKKKLSATAKKLEDIILTIKVKAGENGKIFGGVTSKEISEELKKQNKIEIDKKKFVLAENIKNLGTFNVSVKLYEGVTGSLKVKVVSE